MLKDKKIVFEANIDRIREKFLFESEHIEDRLDIYEQKWRRGIDLYEKFMREGNAEQVCLALDEIFVGLLMHEDLFLRRLAEELHLDL